jgi:phosphoribosyl 1,2-cyclic phosphodiesterase
MLRARVLASSSVANATVLEDGDRRVLLDAGLAYPDLFGALEGRVQSLDAVFVTHEHADHARGVDRLLRQTRVPVYATAGTWAALGSPSSRYARTIRPLEPVRLGAWAALAFPVTHDAREPVGYLVAGRGGKALYMTDASSTRYRFRNVTIALVEANHDRAILEQNVAAGHVDRGLAARIRANHLSVDRAIELLRATNLETIEEIHLLHLSDGNADARAFRDRVERATGRPTYVAGHQVSLS